MAYVSGPDLIESVLLTKLEVEDRLPRLAGTSHSLITSLWQKAIRRGDEVWAVAAARELAVRNADYAWRRIRVIALEDVGLGSLNALSSIFSIAGKRALHRRMGEADTLAKATLVLCRSQKSRSACDVVTLAAAHAKNLRMGARNDQSSPEEDVVASALSMDDPAWVRYRRMQRICGYSHWVRGELPTAYRVKPADRQRLFDSLQLDPVMRMIIVRGRDCHGLAPALLVAMQEMDGMLNAGPSLRLTSGGGGGELPPYSMCMYTPEGRLAIREWLTSDAQLRSFIARGQLVDARLAVGLAVFQIEGSFLANELCDAGLLRLRMTAEYAELEAQGMSGSMIREFLSLVASNLWRLNQIRKSIAVR